MEGERKMKAEQEILIFLLHMKIDERVWKFSQKGLMMVNVCKIYCWIRNIGGLGLLMRAMFKFGWGPPYRPIRAMAIS